MSDDNAPTRKGGGLLGALKNMIVEEEAPAETEVASTPALVSPTRSAYRTPPVVTTVGASVATAVDPAFRAKLESVVASANQASYTEFASYLDSLSDIPDELQRFRAALKVAAKRGHTKDKILAALQVILETLDREAQQFKAAVPVQIENSVGARQRAVASLDQQISIKEQQIAQLQSEIAGLKTQRQAEQSAVKTEEDKVRSAEARFNGAYAAIRQFYAGEQEKVTRFGEGVS